MAPTTPRRRRVPVATPRPATVAVVAVVVVVGIMAVLAPFQDDLARATKALLLVVPVVGAAALGGRAPGYVAAAAATLAFSLSLPPIGSVRVAVTEDVVALGVFLAVAVIVSTLVASRIAALAEADRQRTLLLRSVSHDLRTPLATIRGVSTELLDGAEHDRATTERLLRLVDVEAARLDRLVANLLDLSRIESGAMVPRRGPVEPAELVDRAISRFGLQPTDTRLRVVLEDDLPTLDVDAVQIEQVLDNLLDNAIRHSPPGEPVTVLGVRADRQVRLIVSDRGPGVGAESAELIFQPFRSGTLAGSSGVGLAISRAIVERHGGTITVDDEPGGGARFTVSLPLP
jgi:K+-sensing histidine kinase KdpD